MNIRVGSFKKKELLYYTGVMFDKGEGSIELPEDVENSLLDAVWT
jgi:hypothetical protein